MGVITISMSDEDEQFLRELAKSKHGDKKGSLSKTIIEMLKKVDETNKKDRFIKLIKESTTIHLGSTGGKIYESRNELYDR